MMLLENRDSSIYIQTKTEDLLTVSDTKSVTEESLSHHTHHAAHTHTNAHTSTRGQHTHTHELGNDKDYRVL